MQISEEEIRDIITGEPVTSETEGEVSETETSDTDAPQLTIEEIVGETQTATATETEETATLETTSTGTVEETSADTQTQTSSETTVEPTETVEEPSAEPSPDTQTQTSSETTVESTATEEQTTEESSETTAETEPSSEEPADDSVEVGSESDDDIEGSQSSDDLDESGDGAMQTDEMSAEVEELEASGVFDQELYLALNQDVAAAVEAGITTAEEHFLQFGRYERREFSAIFSVSSYLEYNQDVAQAVEVGETTAFDHFKAFGRFEKRECSKFFSVKDYLELNQDVAQAVEAGETTAFDHFKGFGRFEKREFSKFFSVKEYLELNQDVAQAVEAGETTAFDHFYYFGRFESREFSSIFSVSEYLELNQDVNLAVLAGETTVYEHLLEFGVEELRSIHPLIDLSFFVEENSAAIASFFGTSEITEINSLSFLSYVFSVAIAEGFQTSNSFGLDLIESNFGSQLLEIFNVSSFSEISVEALFEYFSSSAGQDLLLGGELDDDLEGDDDAGEDVDGGEGAGDDAGDDGAEGEGEDITQDPDTLPPLDDNFPEVDDGIPGNDTPDESDSAPATPLFDLDYALDTYGDELAAEFPDFDFENPDLLTEDQIGQIQDFLASEGLAASPFADVEFYKSAYGAQMAEFFNTSVEELTNAQVLDYMSGEGLEQGISPSPLVSFSFYRSAYKLQLESEFGVSIDQISNAQLLEFVLDKGIASGNDPSPFFSFSFYKQTYKAELEAKYGVSIDQITNEQIFQFANGEGLQEGLSPSAFVRVGYFKALYAEELTAAFSVESVEELSSAQILTFLSTTGLQQGLSPSAAVAFGYIKAVFGAELTAEFGAEYTFEQVLEFITTKGLAEGFNPSPFVNLQYSKQLYREEIRKFYDIESVADFGDTELIKNVFDDGKGVFVDVKFVQMTYAAELEAFYGVSVAELTVEQVESFALGELADAGKTLSAFKFTSYAETYSSELIQYYEVESIEEITEQQIYQFAITEGLKLELSLSEHVEISYYEELYSQALEATFEGSYGDEDVIEFVFGDAAPYIDIDYYKELYGDRTTTEGVSVADLDDDELRLYVLTEGFDASIALSPFNLELATQDLSTELESFFGVAVEEITQVQIRNFLVEEGFKLGIDVTQYVEDVEFYREAYSAELAQQFFGGDVAQVANLSAQVVLDFAFNGISSYVNYEYVRAEFSEDLLAFYSEATSISEITNVQILEYVYSEVFSQDGFSLEGFDLSPIDYAGYASAYSAEIAQYFEIEASEVEQLDVELVRDFIFGKGAELGLSVEQYVKLEYIGETYGTAIAATSEEAVTEWIGAEAGSLDIAYVRYQISQLVTEGTITLTQLAEASLISADVEDLSALSNAQLVELVSQEEFTTLLTEASASLEFTVSETVNVTFVREVYGAAIAESLGVAVEEVVGDAATVSDEDVLAAFNSDFAQVDLAFVRYQLQQFVSGEEATLTIADLNGLGLFATEITEISDLTDADVASLVASEDFAALLGEGQELLTAATAENVAYYSEVYTGAIAQWLSAEGSQFALDWVQSEFGQLDVEYLRYQIEQLSADQLTNFGISSVEEVASLSIEKVLNISFSSEFKAFFETDQVKLGAIDVEGYRQAYEAELIAFFGPDSDTKKGTLKIKSGSGKTTSGKLKTGSLKIKSGSLKGGSVKFTKGSGKFKSGSFKGKTGSKGLKLKSGSLKLKTGTFKPKTAKPKTAKNTGEIADGSTVEFDVNSLSEKQIIKFMFGEGFKQGLDPFEFVEVEYLRQEFAVELSKHYGLELTEVTSLNQWLVADYLYGGLSDEIDFEFYRQQYESELTSQFGVSIEQVTDVQILEHAYTVALPQGLAIEDFNVEQYAEQYQDELAFFFDLNVDDGTAELSEQEVITFALTKGLEIGLELEQFAQFDYYRESLGDRALANYRVENVYNLSYEQTFNYMMSGGIEEGLNTSPAVDLEWYREFYADAIAEDTTLIDTNGDGDIANNELFDYITGAGLEKGQNPSDLFDLAEYRQTNSDALLAFAQEQGKEVTTIEEVSYSLTMEYALSVGLEQGIALGDFDPEAYVSENAGALTEFYKVQSIEEITNVQAFNYRFGVGLPEDSTMEEQTAMV
ncbi:hypothetical protein JJD41_06395 [Oxynema sp. CENA135]|uniref:hypothetical protein n=1 Tax=Oxynema sp. CENA135 TaxID=984206 RepID=UPI00190D53C4|nr:hypothetical protein [Oxynema sp. CENA135]MBK4729495.1 hypothetical protein [Oxynema sp. CENA135]